MNGCYENGPLRGEFGGVSGMGAAEDSEDSDTSLNILFELYCLERAKCWIFSVGFYVFILSFRFYIWITRIISWDCSGCNVGSR